MVVTHNKSQQLNTPSTSRSSRALPSSQRSDDDVNTNSDSADKDNDSAAAEDDRDLCHPPQPRKESPVVAKVKVTKSTSGLANNEGGETTPSRREDNKDVACGDGGGGHSAGYQPPPPNFAPPRAEASAPPDVTLEELVAVGLLNIA